MTEEGRGTLYLVPMPYATGVVAWDPVEPGGSVGVVYLEGYVLPVSKDLASK